MYHKIKIYFVFGCPCFWNGMRKFLQKDLPKWTKDCGPFSVFNGAACVVLWTKGLIG
jgi:hypothetical protein